MWSRRCAFHCAGEMISNFCRVLEISEINLVVTLALVAELLLNPDFPMLILLLLVVEVCAFTWEGRL